MHDLSELVGAEVRRIAFDYQVTLLLVAGPAEAERVSASLQIEAPLRVEHDGQVVECDPNDKATHGGMTHILHLVVTDASLDADDTLRLTFDDGTSLAVARDVRYESWNLTGEGVPHIVMGPL
ncbi:MAG: hypothetical protein QOI56_668 [Actinomycetota bacterium]|nr:hypothetical protein [Actinomycetota bacterium]